MYVDLCRSITIHRSNKLINKLGFGKRCNYNLIPEQPPSIPINRVTNCAIIIILCMLRGLRENFGNLQGLLRLPCDLCVSQHLSAAAVLENVASWQCQGVNSQWFGKRGTEWGEWTGKQSPNKMFYVLYRNIPRDKGQKQQNKTQPSGLFLLYGAASFPLIDPTCLHDGLAGPGR